MRYTLRIAAAAIALLTPFHAASARKAVGFARSECVRAIAVPPGTTDNPASTSRRAGAAPVNASDTTWLYSANFNLGSGCSAQGWTSVDLTAQTGNYWHVDDYAGLLFGPLQGSKSLWCGVRPGTGDILCTYATLPGYGDAWDQRWCTKACLTVAGGATSDLDVSFLIRFDSEPSYDATSLEYTTDCTGNADWTEIDGGNPLWTGQDSLAVNSSYAVGPGPVKVRLRFQSDNTWSDQDGFYDSDGAVHIDSLKVESLSLETFEDEPVGSTTSDDWESCNTSFGDFAGLFSGSALLQEDPCRSNLSCMWAFIAGSTTTYACGGHPEQVAVPYVNARGEYISNEIWSPPIPLTGSGAGLTLQFDVYRDLPANSQLFYVWHVRTIVNGCPTPWKDHAFLFTGDDKTWFRQVENLGNLVKLTNATHVQVALGLLDMCRFWCGVFGSPCHSHAPLFDYVKVYRVNTVGPQWTVRGVDAFQDTFATDGTITGTARADEALDIKPTASPTFTPGDSAVVFFLVDPQSVGTLVTTASGLLADPVTSTYSGRHKTKRQCYMYVAVWPLGQAGKSGAPLSEGPGGQANRYPFMGTVVANGVTWTKIRMDYTYDYVCVTWPCDGRTLPARFNVDLNDHLFEPGDTVCYFYAASSPNATNYFSANWGTTTSISEAAANPMEFTILPAGGFNRGGVILYVDGADGFGDQPYFDGAFQILGLADKVDRFDVLGPSSAVSNRLGGRVYNVPNQLNSAYHAILWDCASLPVTLGDGSGDPEKTDDYALLNTFMDNIGTAGFPYAGGLYLCGDDVAQNLAASASASASAFRSNYIEFSLASSNHIAAGLGVSPKIIHFPGRMFSDDAFAFGGCPQLNDFDVLTPTGPSLIQVSYGASQSADGAVLSHGAAHPYGDAKVVLSGFSLAALRDDELNGISDRAEHLHDIIAYLVDLTAPPTSTPSVARNDLSQNYPNPFNPQTTIAFSIKQRGHVTLAVYNVAGQRVRTLANETRPAGPHTVRWDGLNDNGQPVSSGVYFYRLVAGDFSQTKKMVLLK